MKRIGFIDARRLRYIVAGDTKFAVYSWGAIIASGSIYLASDYGAYLNSWAAGKLEVCAATEVRMRAGGKGFSVNTAGQLTTAYGILCTAVIDLRNGRLRLEEIASPVSVPGYAGVIWLNTTLGKLEFSTAAGVKETVTSA